jgi:hypothetical protein
MLWWDNTLQVLTEMHRVCQHSRSGGGVIWQQQTATETSSMQQHNCICCNFGAHRVQVIFCGLRTAIMVAGF